LPDDDATLMDRVARGDDAALAALIARYGGRVRNYLGHVFGRPHLADEVTQDTFVRCARMAARFDARQTLPVWLLRIARNLAIDVLRGEQRQRRRLAECAEVLRLMTGPAPGPFEAAVEAELRDLLARELARLPEPFRSAFVLREIELLDHAEIATIMGTSEKTVSTRLHRARMRLRERLARHLEDR